MVTIAVFWQPWNWNSEESNICESESPKCHLEWCEIGALWRFSPVGWIFFLFQRMIKPYSNTSVTRIFSGEVSVCLKTELLALWAHLVWTMIEVWRDDMNSCTCLQWMSDVMKDTGRSLTRCQHDMIQCPRVESFCRHRAVTPSRPVNWKILVISRCYERGLDAPGCRKRQSSP